MNNVQVIPLVTYSRYNSVFSCFSIIMTDIKLVNLPYLEELIHLYPFYRDLPQPILLDSNQPSFPNTDYDILVANPIASISATLGDTKASITWRDQALFQIDESLPVMESIESLIQQACQLEWATSATSELPFTGGVMGYFGYDAGHFVENLPNTVIHDVDLPIIQAGLYGWAIVSLHKTKQTILIQTPWCDEQEITQIIARHTHFINTNKKPQDTDIKDNLFKLEQAFQSNMSADEYQVKFEKVQQYIQAGDCYQVNLAQRFSSRYSGDPLNAYQSLRKSCPTPFSAFMEIDKLGYVLSHSPERFLQVNQGQVESKPIKGTRARGKTPEEDHSLAQDLLNSTKDKAENLMIVDLLRNDMGKTCDTGSIKVPKLFALESYPNVHHLVSTVTGSIQDKEKHFNVFKHSFPGGSITGAPKIRAMQIIDELEPHERSVYCGSIAYFSLNGQMDSSITIRSLVADQENIHCWAGGGLVSDSQCQDEYHETFTKVKRLTHTLETEFLN
ncbi:aminodeoxychorismate synthase component I [Marinomonas sp. MED121]|uniref:aminodeoxychorismate synthase component I n=1 Tax=Marinomonas sp. MED121 TaxID=314277 RepID=UPI001F5F28DD|nr:aminodeoxychorismate synthase component I [Marinomonas sp. MED121]